jgi:hypothetical protein
MVQRIAQQKNMGEGGNAGLRPTAIWSTRLRPSSWYGPHDPELLQETRSLPEGEGSEATYRSYLSWVLLSESLPLLCLQYWRFHTSHLPLWDSLVRFVDWCCLGECWGCSRVSLLESVV